MTAAHAAVRNATSPKAVHRPGSYITGVVHRPEPYIARSRTSPEPYIARSRASPGAVHRPEPFNVLQERRESNRDIVMIAARLQGGAVPGMDRVVRAPGDVPAEVTDRRAGRR